MCEDARSKFSEPCCKLQNTLLLAATELSQHLGAEAVLHCGGLDEILGAEVRVPVTSCKRHGVGCGERIERCVKVRVNNRMMNGCSTMPHQYLYREMLWRRQPWGASGCTLAEMRIAMRRELLWI
jgi:hypothetical protein